MTSFWRLSAYYFFYFAFIGALSPYFGLYLKSLDFNAWDIGVLMSLMQVMRVVAPNLWGWLADHSRSAVGIVRFSALMSVLGFAGFFFTTSFGGVFLAMAVLAFFWSAALPLVEALVLGQLGKDTHRYGSIRLWGSVGFIAAVLLIGQALDRFPASSFLWMAVLLLLGILGSALLLPAVPTRPVEEAVDSLRETLRRKEVQALLGACFFMSAAHGALYVFYSIFLVANGYSKAAVGALWSLGVVAEIGVFLIMPRLLRRASPRQILVASFGCAVVRFLMIGWGVGHPSIIFLAQLLHGATFGAYHAATVAVISKWFPGRLQARGQALYGSVSFGAGGMLGGLASGWAWDWAGPALTYSLGSAFALVGLLWLAAGWRERSADSAMAR